MKLYTKNISILVLASLANAKFIKRDPYWVRMSDIIQQVRPDFYYGVATTKAFFNSPKYKDIVSTFNLHVATNECKFYTIQGSSSDTFDTSQCDASLEYAKSFGAKYRGHTLFWPANSPNWFKTYSDDVEINKQYILNYAAKVLDHYKDDDSILYWDVINESVKDGSNSTLYTLRTGSSNSNEFLGWDTYTEDLFTLAREHTNPNVKLCYNDYNAEGNNGNFEGKTGAVFNYVNSLKEKDLIDCVGFQMHVSCNYYPTYEQLYQVISNYEEIGVEVHITEMDVSMKNCETHEEQRKIYSDVFKACFDHPNCKVFTVWGVYDSESWIGEEYLPLPFDQDMYPKDIYFDMLDYVMEKLPADATYPTPTVTTRPTTSVEAEIPNAIYLIKPGTNMLYPSWSSWSWDCSVSFDDDGNGIVTYYEEKNGAFSLRYNSNFNAGTLHFELKADQPNIPIKIDVQTSKTNQAVLLQILEDIPTDEMVSYDLKIPAVEGGYNRISFRNIEAKNITLTINNYYYIRDKEEKTTTTTTTVIESTTINEDDTTTIEPTVEPITTTESIIEATTSVESTVVEPTIESTVVEPTIEPTTVEPTTVEPTTVEPTIEPTTVEPTIEPTTSSEPEPTQATSECWAEQYGYKCCTKKYPKVVYKDSKGKWGVEHREWCGIIENNENSCWSQDYGYPCCKNKNTRVRSIDNKGSWGVEHNEWCGIESSKDCKYHKIGIPCCTNKNPKVYQKDEFGKYSIENKNWCGIKN